MTEPPEGLRRSGPWEAGYTPQRNNGADTIRCDDLATSSGWRSRRDWPRRWCFARQGPIEPRPKADPQARPKEDSKQDDESHVNMRIDTTLVLVPVEVSDALNRPVSGLEKENFKIFDDKVEQKIVSFAMEDDPIAVGLVFDVSGSMARRYSRKPARPRPTSSRPPIRETSSAWWCWRAKRNWSCR